MNSVDESSSSSHLPRILVCCTGSVAAIKLPLLVDALASFAQIQIACSHSSTHFFDVSSLSERYSVYSDEDEWDTWSSLSDPVLHIELRRWADMILVAPLSANSLAKFSHGLADSLVSCIARAWEFSKPFLVAPSMNTAMWDHPITRTQLDTLRSWGVEVIPPVSKKLACGDIGMGAMAEVNTIVECVRNSLLEVSLGASKRSVGTSDPPNNIS